MVEALLESALRVVVLTSVVGFGLRAPALRNPRIQFAAWTIVLAASLSMPIAGRLATAVLPPIRLPAAGIDRILPPGFGGFEISSEIASSSTSVAAQDVTVATTPSRANAPARLPGFDWTSFALTAYASGFGVLLIRLITGLVITGRTVAQATPIRELWTAGRDIRVSSDIRGPATFGSIILLPPAHVDWPRMKRATVVAHEAAHVRRGDFYVQLAANLNRAIFWFSPASWWLRRKLSELAEMVSDDEAMGHLSDRSLYAEILLEMASRSRIPSGVVPMARPATLRVRIERILADTPALPPLGAHARIALVAVILPIVAVIAAPLATSSATEPQEGVASPEQQTPHRRITINHEWLDAYVGFYEDMATQTVVTVSREDDHLIASWTGRSPIAEYPFTEHDFFQTSGSDQISFTPDALGKVTRLVQRKYGLSTVFARITSEAAAQLQADFDRRTQEELSPRTPIKIETSLLDRYVGFYRLTSIYYFSITREGDQLFAQGTDQKKYAIYPYSDRDFFYTVVAAQVTFQTPNDGAQASALVLHQDGKDRTATRVTAEAAREFQQRWDDELAPRTAVPIDLSLLDRYVGHYSGPTVSMTITRDGDRLYAQVLGYTRYRVYPYTDHDFFASTFPAQISFLESRASRVVQLVRHEHGVDLVLDRLD